MTEWKKVGTFGVDAGLCWIGDPCYLEDAIKEGSLKNWDKFCDMIGDTDTKEFTEGVVVSTGYGDGRYPVYVKKTEKGRIIEARIVFIDEETDDYYDDEEDDEDSEEE